MLCKTECKCGKQNNNLWHKNRKSTNYGPDIYSSDGKETESKSINKKSLFMRLDYLNMKEQE